MENRNFFTEAPVELQSTDIFVDAEGDWYNAGVKMLRGEIIQLFLQNLHRAPNGGFYIQWQDTRCSIRAEDTPLVIGRVDFKECPGSGEEILVKLRHLDGQLQLDPASLTVGNDDVLYGVLGSECLPARFSRPAYYQLVERLQEDEKTGDFFLQVGNGRHTLRKR